MKKESDLHYLYLQTVNFRKISEIAEDYNFGTEYARNVNFFVKMWSFGYSTLFH